MNVSKNIRNFDIICMMKVTHSYHSNRVVAYFCKVINRIEVAIVTCNYMLSTLLNDIVVYVSVVVVLLYHVVVVRWCCECCTTLKCTRKMFIITITHTFQTMYTTTTAVHNIY